MPNTDVGKILLLVGQIDGKLDSLSANNTKDHDALKTRLDKTNGSIQNHEHRLTVMETEDEVTEKISEDYIKKHQRVRTIIFAVVAILFTAINVLDRVVN